MNIISYCIENINTEVTKYSGYGKTKELNLQCRIFSDNIIMAIDLTDNNYINAKILQILLTHIAEMQMMLISQHKVLIRGAVVQGTVYFGEDYVFGRGLIKAYQMEANEAKYPRIILDDNCRMLLKKKTALKKDIDEYRPIWEYATYDIYEYILEDEEEQNVYINYLYVEKEDSISQKKAIKQNLRDHKNLIVEGIEDTKDENVLKKYFWSRDYHNKVCEKYDMLNLKIQ